MQVLLGQGYMGHLVCLVIEWLVYLDIGVARHVSGCMWCGLLGGHCGII